MTQLWNSFKHSLLELGVLVFLLTPFYVFGDGGYVSLLGLPLDEGGKTLDMTNFIQTAMRMLIIAAALVAVIKIILAGAQYVLSGIVPDKEQAKKDIRSALLGLLIILAAVVVLRTINPSLTNLPALEPIGDRIPWGDILPDTPGEDDTIAEWCEDGGGCNRYTCDGLNDYFWEIAGAGGVVAVGAGIGVGVVSGPITGLLAILGGGYAAYTSAEEINSLGCHAKCSVFSGRYAGSVCHIPNDVYQANLTEARRFAEEQDALRAEKKAEVAIAEPKTDNETTDYFGLPADVFTRNNFGDPVDTIDDIISIEDKRILEMRYEIYEDSDTDRVAGKFTIFKNVPMTPEAESEYETMLANTETKIRSKCTGVIEKMVVTETSTTNLGSVFYRTTYYCVTPPN